MSEKTNWTNIRANFIVEPNEGFSIRKFAEKYDIKRATLHLKATTVNEETGRTWYDDRRDFQERVQSDVDNKLIKNKVKAKLELIQRDELLMDAIYRKLKDRLNKKSFKITNENVAEFSRLYLKYKESYAKLREIINDTGGGKRITFNINVPVHMLTQEGIDWVKDRLDHPNKLMEDAAEAEYEEIPEEDDVEYPR